METLSQVGAQVSAQAGAVKESVSAQLHVSRTNLELPTRAAGAKAPRPVAGTPSLAPQVLRNNIQTARDERSAAASAELAASRAAATVPDAPVADRAAALWGVARAAASKLASSSIAETARAASTANASLDERVLRDRFPQVVAAGGGVLGSFPCSAAHLTGTVRGTVMVTSTHLCFSDGIRGHVAEAVAWGDVVSSVPSVALPTYSGPPHLLPVPESNVRPDSLAVHLADNCVEHPAGILQLSAVECKVAQLAIDAGAEEMRSVAPAAMLHAAVDFAWRGVVTLPVAGVEYAE